jgi:hypothetical protein
MRKKSTSKKGKGKSRAELRAQLARDISAVLTNSECPVGIYNDLTDSVSDMLSNINFDSPELIEMALVTSDAKEEKRKGGVR